MKFAGLAGVLLAVAAASPSTASAQEQWSFALTPYLWLPNINGTLKYSLPPGGNGAPEAAVGPNDYLQNLQAALMLAAEARNGKWSVVSDLIYLDFGSQESSVKAVNFGGPVVDTSLSTSARSSLTGVQWMLAGGYTMIQTPSGTLDLLGGFRYLGIEATTDWQLAGTVNGPGGGQTFPASGSIAQRTDLWDAIVGVRGRVRLGDGRWFAPYHLDVGAGSSRLTWQGAAGIAYAFKWGDATLGYRHLYYDQSGDKLVQNFRFSGPSVGVSFRF
jgi:opacity protein-like surface antigen